MVTIRKEYRQEKKIAISTDTVVVCVGTKRDCQCHRNLLLRQSFFFFFFFFSLGEGIFFLIFVFFFF